MTRIEALLAELAHETKTTRKHLERLPTGQFEWRPHAKSFTAGELASHMVDCIRWVEPVFGADELDMDPSTFRPFVATSVTALLEAFDAELAKATQVMARSADTSASQPWRFKMRGKVWFEKPREAVFRDMALSQSGAYVSTDLAKRLGVVEQMQSKGRRVENEGVRRALRRANGKDA